MRDVTISDIEHAFATALVDLTGRRLAVSLDAIELGGDAGSARLVVRIRGMD